MGGDGFEEGVAVDFGGPLPGVVGEGGVEDEPGDVHGAVGAVAHGVRTTGEAVAAPGGEFGEGEAAGKAAADVAEAGLGGKAGAGLDLEDQEAGEILGVEDVADLEAVAAEAEVAKGSALAPGVDPVGDDALIGAAELAGSGEDAAAVDPDVEAKGGVVLEGELLGAEFAGAVEGEGRLGGEGFRDAGVGDPVWGGSRVHAEAEVVFPERDAAEIVDAVNAGGAEHEEAGAASAAELEHVEGADEVVFEELAAAGAAVEAGEDAGVGGGVDDPVHVGEGLEVAGQADVAMEEAHTELLEGEAIDLGAGTAEVVEAEGGPAAGDEVAEDLAAGEAAGTGDENAWWGG